MNTTTIISNDLSDQFRKNGITISSSASITIEIPDFRWTVTDSDKTYVVIKQPENGILTLQVYGGKGKIPNVGAKIKVESYQIVLGKEVKIGKDMLIELIDDIPRLQYEDILGIKNEPAEGGNYIYPREEMLTTGL